MTIDTTRDTTSDSAISISGIHKTYANGLAALDDINLDIRRGEIFALLGPNGAGKTTLINAVCGIVQPTSGHIHVCGHDIVRDYRQARAAIGLVPQELTTDAFVSVWNAASFSRGLFGKPHNPDHIERTLRNLALWDKRDEQIRRLSGGMKRRVMIAKALAHEPEVLFLDEPTSGVDIELRKSMWEQVRALRETGVTIILTTHYIEEAEEMADRIGIIHKGRLILTERKTALMRKMGKNQMIFTLPAPVREVPASLAAYDLAIDADGSKLVYTYNADMDEHDASVLIDDLMASDIRPRHIECRQSSLEEIFMQLVSAR
jgi:ABC-2 type transport system ATP-binding protein